MRRRTTFQPYCAYDAMGYTRILRIAAEQRGDMIAFLMWTAERDYVWAGDLGEGQIKEFGEPGMARFVKAQSDPIREAANFKQLALRYGATPEAIRLLGLLAPVSREEELSMAEKLKAKGGAAAKGKAPTGGDAEALKTAAKSAPVAKKVAAKAEPEVKGNRKGNVAALDKAREVRAAGTAERDKQKIKVLNKDHGAREGTNRANQLNIVLRAKTVGAAIEAGATWVDVKFAVSKGLIELA